MKRLSIFLGLVALISGPLAAGVVYEIEVTDHEQSPPKSESIQVAAEGRNLIMGIASGGSGKQGEMIFRGDRREMVVVDHDDNTYLLMDKATMEQIAGQVSSAMSQIEEALKNVPEDKRAMVEEMMRQRMPEQQQQAAGRPQSELRRTDERGDKNGYPCVKYEVYREGLKIREMWVTDWDNVEGGSDVVEVFEDMAGFFRELMEAIPSFGQGDGGDPMFEHLKDLGGFPVVTEEFDENGNKTGESSLRSARRQTLDPAAFEPPSGYKRRSMGPR